MKPYNPLEKENLGKSVAESLLNAPPERLDQLEAFTGAGIYAIYYLGDFPAYQPIAEQNPSPTELRAPIDVGKAIPIGGRKGAVDPEISAKGHKLFKRLDEHRKSIAEVSNLRVEDFYCRYLVVDDVWIPLGESLIIQHFRPLWNLVVEGFGNHNPGGRSLRGKTSQLGRPPPRTKLGREMCRGEIFSRRTSHQDRRVFCEHEKVGLSFG